MKTKHIFFTIAALAVVSCGGQRQQVSLTGYVDPFIGTGDHGHVFLGANVPFGMVQLGPSQVVKGWDWCSGYHYSDSVLVGFSHTHLSGTGIGDLGDITFLPGLARTNTVSHFSHAGEECRPGYYKVRLDDSGIGAELSATTRAGIHRYTYPENTDTAFVRVDLSYGIGWDKASSTHVGIDNDSTISGYRLSTGWANDQRVYFTARFSRPIVAAEVDSSVAVLAFIPDGRPLLAKVGISAVSEANSAKNLDAEIEGWDFDGVATRADEAWNAQLSKIMIETADETEKRKFYTALYHTMFFPATFSDVNGDYRGADGNIHNTDGKFTDYTILSLWDTYRAAHPLSTIIHPEMQSDFANTFINIYRQQGKLPVWHLHGNETNCMIGNPGVIVLADLLLKGYVADTTGAYEAMKASCMLQERSLGELQRYGYVPFDAQGCEESVAKGMEYAVADDAVARVARKIGRDDDAAYFERRGKAYACYFDSVTQFMRGRSIAGGFRDEKYNPFFTAHRADDYCEGNGWQYVWMVPHDPHGLAGLFGSDDKLIEKFDRFFTVEGDLGDEASPDISGMIGQYAHGNEPSHHAVYLYSYFGQPYKSAPLLRRIMTELYHSEPAGLCGNEDAGQMSAWYVLSSMGIYQVEPAGGKFIFGSPMFDKATIDVGGGRSFEIVARNNSRENIYVQSATLDGEPYEKSWIDFARIAQGGRLVFEMGPKPSKTFGTNEDARP